MEKEEIKKTEEVENLTDFEWDEEIEFFGIKTDTEDVKGIEKKEEEKEEKEEKKEKKKETEEEETEEKKEIEEEKVEFFDNTEKEKETEEETEFFTTLASELKESGVFQNVEIPEDEPIDQDKFVELQDEEVNARVEEALEGFIEELDDDGKAFLKFKKEGGRTEDFFKVIEKKSSLPKGDLEDDKYQKKLVEYYSRIYEGLEDDEINDRIEWLEDSGKLKRYAERYEDKIQKAVEKEEKEAIKRQEILRKQQEEADKKFVESLKNKLSEVDKIKQFPITKKDKTELISYLTKPAVKVGKNKFLTRFQADMQEVTKDYDKLILLAKLIKEVVTKKTTDLKKKLERQKTTPKIKGSGSSTKKSLSDYF